MIRGLYTSALGMTTQMQKMDVVANNIANVNTTGYKKDMVVTRSFSEELMRRLDDPGYHFPHDKAVGNVSQGVFVDDVYVDFSNGSLQNTGGSLNLAISGSGFFAVQTMDGNGNPVEMYTRDGAFTRSADGTLMTKEGNKVAGLNGDIVLEDGHITIDQQGGVYVNDNYVDTIKMVDFEDKHTLRKTKDNLYMITPESSESVFSGTVEQGVLENSNVNSVKEMVDIITVSRAYEANQRMITIHDTTLNRAVNDIGRK